MVVDSKFYEMTAAALAIVFSIEIAERITGINSPQCTGNLSMDDWMCQL
jgi:hypothetical protein